MEKEGRCETHKDSHACKQTAREIHIKDILTLALWDDILKTEFKRLKSNHNTEDKCIETSNTWNIENATKEAYNSKQTLTKEDIHTISLHQSKQQIQPIVIASQNPVSTVERAQTGPVSS